MKTQAAGSRRRRWPLVALAIGLATAALVAFAPPTAPVEVNVSPLASVSVAGQVGRVVPGSGIEYCLPKAMLDGTLDTLYLAEIHPTPFFALALLAVATPLPAWAERLARVELFARRLFPLAIVVLMPGGRGEPGLSRFGLLGDDLASCIALACLAPLAWLGLAWWVATLPRGGSATAVVEQRTPTATPPV